MNVNSPAFTRQSQAAIVPNDNSYTKALNVFEQASKMPAVSLHKRAGNLIFDSFITDNIPAFHESNKKFDTIYLVITPPFENGILGEGDGARFAPICECTVSGFDFQSHGQSLAYLFEDDVDFVATMLARLFARLSNGTVSFAATYSAIKALNDDNDTSNVGRLVLNTTLAQRDNVVYYFTRCSMKLYDWLLTINDGTTQRQGIDTTVANKLMWLDRGVLFKDLQRNDRDHYLWFNSAFKWFCSELVSRYRGAAPEVEKLNEFSEALYLNSRKASGATSVHSQMFEGGAARARYAARCEKVIRILHHVYETHDAAVRNQNITNDALKYHTEIMAIYYKSVDALNLKLKNDKITLEQFNTILSGLRDNYRPSIEFLVAHEACRLMVAFYNSEISESGYKKILTGVFAD